MFPEKVESRKESVDVISNLFTRYTHNSFSDKPDKFEQN